EPRLQKILCELQTEAAASCDRRSEPDLYVLGNRAVSDLEIQPEDEMDSRAAKSGRARVLGLEHGNETRQRKTLVRRSNRTRSRTLPRSITITASRLFLCRSRLLRASGAAFVQHFRTRQRSRSVERRTAK